MSKEMLGGCCVCSDERGWAENPLVYCDGNNCHVAVHQACYGIVQVPTGPWYCKKCESPERGARVKCDLCPSKDGALKKTDGSGWAHVVCALYIPEVRFGNVTTMEPIVLTLVPRERFDKTCYICQEQQRGSKAAQGACMPCNKSGCKQHFHVTCAQALGLLCEEAGNFGDNVNYCGYCQHHASKLKKGGNVKTIPAYKPITTGEHDSSPDKDTDANRSAVKKKSYLAVKPLSGLGAAKKEEGDFYAMDTSEPSDTGDGSGCFLKFGLTSSHTPETGTVDSRPNKFTTSNFVETVVTQSEPVFGTDTKTTASPEGAKGRKRKPSSAGVKMEGETATTSLTSTPVSTITSTAVPSKNISASVSQVKSTNSPSVGKPVPTAAQTKSVPPPIPKTNLAVIRTGTKITITARGADDGKKGKLEVADESLSPAAISAFDFPANDNGLDASKKSSLEKGRKPKKTPNKRVAVKEELDSSPDSPERNKKNPAHATVKEEKDAKSLPAPVSAHHMLGNQLNPSSSMAQKMRDSLTQEVEAHSIYTHEPKNTSNLVGPPVPTFLRERSVNDKTATLSAANSLLSLGNPGTGAAGAADAGVNHGSGLDELLMRQWDASCQFLMEQANHFDIASLLTGLHNLKAENQQLEEQISTLEQTRDRLLAANSRLAAMTFNQNPAPPTAEVLIPEQPEVVVRQQQQQQHRMENGIGPEPGLSPYGQMRAPPQASPTLRTAQMNNVFNNQQRRPVVSSYQQYNQQQQQQMNSNPNSIRRDDMHQQM